MKRLFLLFALIVLPIFAIAGCQSMSPMSGGGIVYPQDRVSLDTGPNVGSWRGDDVTVDYSFSRGQHDMDISGTAWFNDHMTTNYTFLRDFQLSAIFTDRDGRVLGSQGLATNRGNLDPTPFRARLVPPAGTAEIAFAYTGTAFSTGGSDDGGGGGGPNSFWQYPIH